MTTKAYSRWRQATALALGVVCATTVSPIPLVVAQDGPAGIVTPIVLPPYDQNARGCAPPTDLNRSLVFLKDNDRDFMQGVDAGLGLAARDRGLEYRVARANNNADLMRRQAAEEVAKKTGAVVVSPLDARTMAPTTRQLLWSGAYVGSVVPPPATTVLNAPQYLTGKVLADAAVSYIEQKLGGKARVVLLTHDSNQFLARRFVAMRDVLTRLPGVTIVADISPSTVDRSGGFAIMQSVLLAQPDVDVVLGADTVVLGALDALRHSKKDRPDQFLGGIDGEPQAVEEIKSGGPFKTSVSLASPIFAYAMGQHAADWLEGKSIPQAIDALPRALNTENLAGYQADVEDPGAVYKDPARRNSYLKMYGNICYETLANYIAFPWSSER